MRLSILIKFFFLLLLPVLGEAAEEFTVYHPKYRSTEELVSLAESQFGSKATFSSLGGKVVINASPKVTESALKLFAEIDKRSRQYKISFRLVSRAENSRNSISFQGGQVSVGKKIETSGTLGLEDSKNTKQATAVQTAELLEGAEAQMALGSSWAPGGFTAKARGGAGDLVTLEFRQREPEANPAFSLSSEVRVKLGEWKTVGGVDQVSNESQTGITQRGSKQGFEAKDLQVKLELAR